MKIHASGEDYLETILILHREMGMVRSVDVARHMDVSKPVSAMRWQFCRKAGFLPWMGTIFSI